MLCHRETIFVTGVEIRKATLDYISSIALLIVLWREAGLKWKFQWKSVREILTVRAYCACRISK